MKSLIRLELRKQRNTFLGLLLILAMSLTLITASVSILGEIPADESFLSITILSQIFGIPFFGIFLGAAAGASLRTAQRKAEEDIPLRPSKRVLAAYITSLLYLIALASILFLAAILMHHSGIFPDDEGFNLMIFAALPLHSAAFVFSYSLSHALVGSVVSAIASGTPAFFLFLNDEYFFSSIKTLPEILLSILAITFAPLWIVGKSDSVFSLVVPSVIASIIHFGLLVWIVNRIEREKKTWMPLKIAMAILVPAALSLSIWATSSLVSTYHRFFMTNCD
jgi:hypothetical protein